MPSRQEAPRPAPLSREQKLTLGFAKLPFNEVIAQQRRLENLLQAPEIQVNEERRNKTASSLEVITRRRDKLVADFRNSGRLDPVDQKIEALKQMGDRLTPEVLREELNTADSLDEKRGVSPTDKHYGILGWHYRKELGKLSVRQQSASPVDSSQERQGSPDSSAEMDSLSQRIEEIKQRLTSGDISEEERIRLVEGITGLIEEQPRHYGSSLFDPEMGRGGERLFDARRIGAGAAKTLFRDRLKILIEEQADQSFDQNWRLVYPLELTIMDLMPKGKADDHVVPPEGEKWESFSLSELRRDLSKELQAYRNVHNYIYVHRRVGGVTPLIEAGALLSRDTIETLIHIPEVAEALGIFEKIGKECYHAKQEAFKLLKGRKKGEGPSSKEEGWREEASSKEGKAKSLMSRSDSKEDELFWARRIAGGLYSGLHESARHDMQINESGDFFTDRLFHAPERAAIQWNNWERNPQPQLLEALNLRVEGFFESVFWEKFKELEKNKNEFKTFCDRMGVSYTFRINKKGKEDGFSLLDLSGAEFGKMDFSSKESDYYLPVKSDEVRLANITLDDADKVRKAIFDPRGFLDDPSMATIKKAYEIFKHLKGEKRSDWVRNVCRGVVLLYIDTVHPWNESASPRSRKCPGKEIYPEMVPWTNIEVTNQLTRMTPPLTENDREELLKEFVGTREKRRLIEDVRITRDVGLSALGEFLKALLGLK